MIIAGHQPEYLPYIGLICKAMHADIFVFSDHLQYGKKQFQNRNRIRTADGLDGWTWLTVPVITRGRFYQKIKDVEINNKLRWQERHLKSIYYSYKGTPFFEEYMPLFEKIYLQKWEKLEDLNEAILRAIFSILKAEIRIIKSSDYGVVGEKTEMLLDMCKKIGGDGYLSGQGGKLYVDESKFKEAGLSHQYCEFNHPVYKQKFQPFVPNMSSIDLLFNEGSKSNEIIYRSDTRYNTSTGN